MVLVDQAPVSRTPRSNPAVYSGAWDRIREIYAATPEAREAGFTASSFSFNSGDGRCDACQGLGQERVEMQFLSDVFVPCPVCEGRRFKPQVLAVPCRGRSVADLLAATVAEAREIFADDPAVERPLGSLESVGLGYLALGQPLNTLSGGEAQRMKLVRYLGSVGSGGGSLLLLDEPTTGLHRHDVLRLLGVLQSLVDRGHSVVVIEHHLDVLKSADWILELGPDAGTAGGRLVAAGTPEAVAAAETATSPFLRSALSGAVGPEPKPPAARPASTAALTVLGARENNLKDLTLSLPHRELTVVTGVSGSGKSTLAFDIVFAEGQRRFLESMSPYARQFVEQLPRPDVDRLTGIPPTVAIEQRMTRGTRKSTVATVTEVAPYLRLLYARLGVQHHPDTGRPVVSLSRNALLRLLARALAGAKARKARHLYLCAPIVRGRKGHHQPVVDWIGSRGYTLLRADGRLTRVDAFRKLDRYREHDIEAVVADLKGAPPAKARQAFDEALRIGQGSCFLLVPSRLREIFGWSSGKGSPMSAWALRRDRAEDLSARGPAEARALADPERLVEGRAFAGGAPLRSATTASMSCSRYGRASGRRRPGSDGRRPAERVALLPDPVDDRLVVALPAPDDRGAEVEVPGLPRLGARRARARSLRSAFREGETTGLPCRDGAGPRAGRTGAEGRGRPRSRSRPWTPGSPGDPLLDRDGRRDAGQPVDAGRGCCSTNCRATATSIPEPRRPSARRCRRQGGLPRAGTP